MNKHQWGIAADMLRNAVVCGCGHLHHRKADHHGMGEECPVVRRYEDMARRIDADVKRAQEPRK